ncbi:uncharacterized protein PGTG_14519 [Puccinia graminis f. sp. tritici CRL 75-36-700-3]|uniref:Uncharacterized protein n=1 Tax=Puccinia graminis f. sp. tritici (strain CRL 75-36-700-3 / race SCCL) TaxID=418459 RepID=E3KU29_PUCGT|nr:uncharacterized protein PGTG_14519 [Puccinia graminis f. sp. tritici CRL 75-36-700-3]EFP87804.2 hypothetical protein PGTG_14519 [Puccinia graminis f. sp. tritici CRL 75-36-700-3]
MKFGSMYHYQQHVVGLILLTACSLQVVQCMHPRYFGEAITESLTEPLVQDNSLSLTHILRDSTPSPKSDEREKVEQHISTIPQLKYQVGKVKKTDRLIESRLDDLKSLRESLNRIRSDPGLLFGYENPSKYLKPHPWNQDQPLYKHVQRLDEIHEKIEQTYPPLRLVLGEKLVFVNFKAFWNNRETEPNMLYLPPQKTFENRNSPTILKEPLKLKEIKDIGIQLVKELTILLSSTQSEYRGQNQLHFLNFQKLVCETVYYFHKHQLIPRENLGVLITNEIASEGFSRYILQSFVYDQNVSRNWLPLNLKNILNNWYHFSCGNMFKDLPEVPKNNFLYYYNKAGFEYYRTYPVFRKNPALKGVMDQMEELLFDKHPTRPENLAKRVGNRNSFVVTIPTDSILALANTFIQIPPQGRSDSELAHLFQVIEYFTDVNPRAFQLHKQDTDFQKKYDLMWTSKQFLTKIENLQIYLESKFNPKAGLDSIFDHPTSSNNIKSINSISHFQELEFLAKYLKIIRADYLEKIDNISALDPYHQYCQRELFEDSFKWTEKMITQLGQPS